MAMPLFCLFLDTALAVSDDTTVIAIFKRRGDYDRQEMGY